METSSVWLNILFWWWSSSHWISGSSGPPGWVVEELLDSFWQLMWRFSTVQVLFLWGSLEVQNLRRDGSGPISDWWRSESSFLFQNFLRSGILRWFQSSSCCQAMICRWFVGFSDLDQSGWFCWNMEEGWPCVCLAEVLKTSTFLLF